MDCRNPLLKPRKNPSEEEEARAVEANSGIGAANMEKLKVAVIKLFESATNAPLSESRKALLGERISQFISLLHTPDHPPYAWMIERAIRELNEKGGSSEDSISKFIRKEYDDLPWSHFTVLKYHLARLCESGEVVLTGDHRYLLGGANLDRKIKRKSRRRSMKRRREWVPEITRNKWRRKVTLKENILQEGDKVELLFTQQNQVTSNEICEQECVVEDIKQQKKNDGIELRCSQQKFHGPSNDVHDEGDCITEGGEQHKLEANVMTETDNVTKNDIVKPTIAEDNDANSNLDALLYGPSSFMSIDEENNLLKFGMQQSTVENISGAEHHDGPDVLLELGWKEPEDNHTERATPARPPGFKPMTLEKSSEFHPQTPVSLQSQVHSEQINQNQALNFCDAVGQSSTGCLQKYVRRLKKQDQTLLIPSAELQAGYSPKPKLSGENKGHTTLKMLSEHWKDNQVVQGNQPSRVLRSQSLELKLSDGKALGKSLASHDQHERPKPESRYPLRTRLPKAVPDSEITTDLTILIHQNDAKAPSNDQDKQTPDHPPPPPTEELEIPSAQKSIPASIGNPQLEEQQLEKARRGRPPNPKGDASIALKPKFKNKTKHRRGASRVVKPGLELQTTYQGRGRPRLTDQ